MTALEPAVSHRRARGTNGVDEGRVCVSRSLSALRSAQRLGIICFGVKITLPKPHSNSANDSFSALLYANIFHSLHSPLAQELLDLKH
mgnify:CR=1 FL=1